MPRRTAIEYSVWLLSRRSRSERELERKLIEKRYSADEISHALQELKKVAFINDEQFAATYTKDKVSIYRRGPRRIFFELLKRGVHKETADKAVKTVTDDEERQAATSLLKGKERQWQKLDLLARKRRTLSLLQRRGFSPKIISEFFKKSL